MLRKALQLPIDQLVGTSTRTTVMKNTSRLYATKSTNSKNSSSPKARGPRGQVEQADSRIDLIKKTLYESSPSDEDRLQALAKVVPSLEVHETITRAWKLHQRNQREARESSLAKKYESMRKALDLLKETSEELFEKAVGGKKFQNLDQEGQGNERLVGLVPRELRAPMELVGRVRWDSEWKRPQVVDTKPKSPKA